MSKARRRTHIRFTKQETIVHRFDLYPQVNKYSSSVGPVLSGLQHSAKHEKEEEYKAFRKCNEIVYSFYKESLMSQKPPQESAFDEQLRHNDSVHALKEMYKRFTRESLGV